MNKILAIMAVAVIPLSLCVMAQDLGGMTKGLGGGSDVKTMMTMKALEKMMPDLSAEQTKEGADKEKALEKFMGEMKKIMKPDQLSKFKDLIGDKKGGNVKGLLGGKKF